MSHCPPCIQVPAFLDEMTESSPQNCSTVAVAVNTLLVSLTLRFIAARQLLPLGDIVEDITRSHNGDKGDSFENLKGAAPSRELWVGLRRQGLQAWQGIRKSV